MGSETILIANEEPYKVRTRQGCLRRKDTSFPIVEALDAATRNRDDRTGRFMRSPI